MQGGRERRIPRGVLLAPFTYMLTVRANPWWPDGIDGGGFGGGEADMTVVVDRSPLVARIAGATSRTVGFDLPMTLDALADS